MKKKVTWEDWKVFAKWDGKTDEQRIELFKDLTPARQEQGRVLMWQEREERLKPERQRLLEECHKKESEQGESFDPSEHTLAFWRSVNKKLDEEGLYQLPNEPQSLTSERIVFGKAKGDPAPPACSLDGMRFLLFANGGKDLLERIQRVSQAIDTLRFKLPSCQWLDSETLKLWKKKEKGTDEREYVDLISESVEAKKEYQRLWEKSKSSGIDHPAVMREKALEAIRKAPRIVIPLEALRMPAHRSMLTKEDIERQHKEYSEQVAEYEAAQARIKEREVRYSAQFGADGGNKSADNARRRTSARTKGRAAGDAPKLEALKTFRSTKPDCTLPQARDHLFDKRELGFQSRNAADAWLRDRVKRKEIIPPFSVAPRGKMPGTPRKKRM